MARGSARSFLGILAVLSMLGSSMYIPTNSDQLKEYEKTTNSHQSQEIWADSVAIDSEGIVGKFSSAVFDSNNYLHVAYFDETNGVLKYANNGGFHDSGISGEWANWTIDGNMQEAQFTGENYAWHSAGNYTSIAVDSNDVIHITYQSLLYHAECVADCIDGSLKYAAIGYNISQNVSSGGCDSTFPLTCHASTIEADIGRVRESSIAIDSNDQIHVSYYNISNDGFGDLNYATFNGTSWDIMTIDEGPTDHQSGQSNTATRNTIVIDDSDNIHIIYNTEIGIKYARKNSTDSNWSLSPIANSERPRDGLDATIDQLGVLHVTYSNYNQTEQIGELMYANYVNNTWSTTNIRNLSQSSLYFYSSSIASDNQNNLYILTHPYSWGGGMRPIYLENLGNGWTEPLEQPMFENWDQNDQPWKVSSPIAIDSNGNIVITYFDPGNGDLRVISKVVHTDEEGDEDTDEDGVMNDVDACPNTPAGETVDNNGCSSSQLDSDNDGVLDANDICPGFDDALDSDGDGTPDGCDDDSSTSDNETGNETIDDGYECTLIYSSQAFSETCDEENSDFDRDGLDDMIEDEEDSDSDGLLDIFEISLNSDYTPNFDDVLDPNLDAYHELSITRGVDSIEVEYLYQVSALDVMFNAAIVQYGQNGERMQDMNFNLNSAAEKDRMERRLCNITSTTQSDDLAITLQSWLSSINVFGTVSTTMSEIECSWKSRHSIDLTELQMDMGMNPDRLIDYDETVLLKWNYSITDSADGASLQVSLPDEPLYFALVENTSVSGVRGTVLTVEEDGNQNSTYYFPWAEGFEIELMFPQDYDDDDDGFADDYEISCGSDPLDASSIPIDEDEDGICSLLDENDQPEVDSEDNETAGQSEGATSGASDIQDLIVPIIIALAILALIVGAITILKRRYSESKEEQQEDSSAPQSSYPGPDIQGEHNPEDGYEWLEHPAQSEIWYYRDLDTGVWVPYENEYAAQEPSVSTPRQYTDFGASSAFAVSTSYESHSSQRDQCVTCMDTPKVLRNCDVCNDLVCNDCLEKYRDAWGRKRKACEDCHEKDTRKEELAKISLGIIVLAGLAIFAYSTFGDQFSTSETPETQIVITASGSWEGRLMVDDDMRDISGSGSKTYTEQGDYISVFVVNGDSEIDSNFQWSTSEICVELVQNGEVIDSDCSSELLGTVEVETGSYIPFAGTLSTISMIALAAGWLARGKNRVA